eukprot:4702491-Amphidinium_carterae.4
MEQAEPEDLVQCPYCDQKRKGGRGLLAHKLKTHRIVPPMALRTRSTSCIACGSQMGTRARMLTISGASFLALYDGPFIMQSL